jgi:nucleotide-binding universal stress UspA family protein
MKIMLAIDDSEFSGDILQAVVAQFRTENTEVRVLHVLQPAMPVPPPQMAPGYAPELEDQMKPARELVERIAGELRRAGFKADTAIEIGDPRERIIDSATEWRADLIVVGSHGRGGFRRFLLGSVAEFVARHTKCSIEIVRTPTASAS